MLLPRVDSKEVAVAPLAVEEAEVVAWAWAEACVSCKVAVESDSTCTQLYVSMHYGVP